ncbi:MAG TPA: hypothetical protein VIJ33_09990 [Solirubrobacteraceae bacterium]
MPNTSRQMTLKVILCIAGRSGIGLPTGSACSSCVAISAICCDQRAACWP